MLVAKRKNTVPLVITLATIAFALYTQIIWAMVASNKTVPHKDHIQLFLSYFPFFLRRIETVTYLTLACSVASIIFSSVWMRRNHGFEKGISIVILILGILITVLTLFQLL